MGLYDGYTIVAKTIYALPERPVRSRQRAVACIIRMAADAAGVLYEPPVQELLRFLVAGKKSSHAHDRVIKQMKLPDPGLEWKKAPALGQLGMILRCCSASTTTPTVVSTGPTSTTSSPLSPPHASLLAPRHSRRLATPRSTRSMRPGTAPDFGAPVADLAADFMRRLRGDPAHCKTCLSVKASNPWVLSEVGQPDTFAACRYKGRREPTRAFHSKDSSQQEDDTIAVESLRGSHHPCTALAHDVAGAGEGHQARTHRAASAARDGLPLPAQGEPSRAALLAAVDAARPCIEWLARYPRRLDDQEWETQMATMARDAIAALDAALAGGA